jgi:hypothetical protein
MCRPLLRRSELDEEGVDDLSGIDALCWHLSALADRRKELDALSTAAFVPNRRPTMTTAPYESLGCMLWCMFGVAFGAA